MNDFKIADGVLEKYYGCEKNIVIPDGVKVIGEDCFLECKFIESVTISESVVEIGGSAFSGCENLKKITFAPNGKLEIIGEDAFSSCGDITELVFPASLRQIRNGAFAPISTLKKLVLNDGLQFIGSSAFEDCHDLPEVFIPASVTRIERNAFAYASQMVAYVEAPSKPVGWDEDWSDDDCPCRSTWSCKRARNANEEQPKTQEVTKAENKTVAVSKEISNENHSVKKKSKLNKSLITYIVILSIGFLATLILSIVGFIKPSMSVVVPLIICSIAEVIAGIALFVMAKKQVKVTCPVCGAKREHHRQFLYTEASEKPATVSSTSWVRITKYRHFYLDTYTCPKCGEVFEENVSLLGGQVEERPTGTIDKRKPPKEF